NAAKNVGVTFHEAGNYTFIVRITNPGGLSVSSAVSLSVNQTVTSINLSPGTAALTSTATAQFLAVASDQFGQPLAVQPAFSWSAARGGTGGPIDATGLSPRATGAIGTDTIVATNGSVIGTASVTVSPGPAARLAVASQPPASITAGS